MPLYGPGNIYNDGLSFDLLFEGYTRPRSCAVTDRISFVLGAALELERSTSPYIFGREQYCEVVKTSPGENENLGPDEVDQLVEESGMLKTIDEFDPDLNNIGNDELDKFFSEYDPTYKDRSRPKGLDYLVMDSF